jgi:hypothetical protein
MVQPTLGIEIGQTYTFIQQDISNYMHPIGFAYEPDGAHDDKPELEPGIFPSDTSGTGCTMNATCPAPMYFVDGNYVGTYSNIAEIKNVTTDDENFGLDDYEPLFFRNPVDWTDFGTFSVMLRFDQSYEQDIFYFCHVSSPKRNIHVASKADFTFIRSIMAMPNYFVCVSIVFFCFSLCSKKGSSIYVR